MEAHTEGRAKPISTGASLLEFEVALSAEASTSTAPGTP
jgi:hypothetical protein